MRSYFIQEISPADMPKLLEALSSKAYKIPIKGLFWITLPRHLHSGKQLEHVKCGPYYMAVEAGDDWLKLELLVRCEQKIRCECIAYATAEQRQYMMEYLDQLIRNQDVRV